MDLRALLRLAPAFKPFKAWDADSIVMPPYSRQRSGPCPEFFHIAQNVACELQYSPGTLRHQSRQKRYRMREVRPCLAGEPKQLPTICWHLFTSAGSADSSGSITLSTFGREIGGLKRNHSAPQTLPTGRAGVKFPCGRRCTLQNFNQRF